MRVDFAIFRMGLGSLDHINPNMDLGRYAHVYLECLLWMIETIVKSEMNELGNGLICPDRGPILLSHPCGATQYHLEQWQLRNAIALVS